MPDTKVASSLRVQTSETLIDDYMGFGKSETPQDREYTATAHIDFGAEIGN
jgi:hypothetical protein